MLRPALAALCAALVTTACSEPVEKVPYPIIDPQLIRTHVQRLAEAQAAGAEPGDRGEQLAVQYMSDTFRDIGLKVQTQSVRLAKIVPKSSALTVAGAGGSRLLQPGVDYVAWSRRPEPAVTVDAEMVFVGYGISSPRQGWNDYKDVDVRGKILVMLMGDPMAGTRHVLGPLGADVFGRRKYKFEEAERRGAAGALLVYTPGQIDGSWEDIARSSGDILDVSTPKEVASYLEVEGWITSDAVQALSTPAGEPFGDLPRLAAQSNFKPVGMSLRASFEVQSAIGSVSTTNVVATLRADAAGAQPDWVVYSARWNDLPPGGRTGSDLTDSVAGNQSTPGAALLPEVARALSRETNRHRSFVFLIVTAESEGMLGLDYLLENPTFPLNLTRAAIHVAGFSVDAGSSNISIVGAGFPALKDLVREQAAEQFRVAAADTDPERLVFYRFAEGMYTAKAIPSVFITSRPAQSSKPDAAAAAQPDMAAAVLDTQLLFHVGLNVAAAGNWPVRPLLTVPTGAHSDVPAPGGGAR